MLYAVIVVMCSCLNIYLPPKDLLSFDPSCKFRQRPFEFARCLINRIVLVPEEGNLYNEGRPLYSLRYNQVGTCALQCVYVIGYSG